MIAIVGTGPAALMAAEALSSSPRALERGIAVFEKRKSAGRKLLVAGSSGLNITNSLPLDRFIDHYTGPRAFWERALGLFPPARWIRFIEDLGIRTFEGTSGRYFVEEMKASRFLQAWTGRLASRGVRFEYGKELTGFEAPAGSARVALEFADGTRVECESACLALGGGSWEPHEKPLRWPAIFRARGLGFRDFLPSNVGYQVEWKQEFLKEAEGLPLKRVIVTSSRASREGDAMVTRYGIEGTPIYFAGMTGEVTIDLKPDLTAEQVAKRLSGAKENLSLIRRSKKLLGLCPASQALLFHHLPRELLESGEIARFARAVKAFPLRLGAPQPLDEAISSSGGLELGELDDALMLRRHPGLFAAGEMLDWDVPTGGFLIQGCVATGFLAAQGILRFLGLDSEISHPA